MAVSSSIAMMFVHDFDDSSAAVKARHTAATEAVAASSRKRAGGDSSSIGDNAGATVATTSGSGGSDANSSAGGAEGSDRGGDKNNIGAAPTSPSPDSSHSSSGSAETAAVAAAAVELAFHEQHWLSKATAALKLFWRSTNMKLLAPLNFTFGFAAALLQYYANKSIVTDQLQPVNSTQSYVNPTRTHTREFAESECPLILLHRIIHPSLAGRSLPAIRFQCCSPRAFKLCCKRRPHQSTSLCKSRS